MRKRLNSKDVLRFIELEYSKLCQIKHIFETCGINRTIDLVFLKFRSDSFLKKLSLGKITKKKLENKKVLQDFLMLNKIEKVDYCLTKDFFQIDMTILS